MLKTRRLIVVLAIVLAVAPWSAPFVERAFSRGAYPRFQPVVTSITNIIPVACLDLAIVILVVGFSVKLVRMRRSPSREGLGPEPARANRVRNTLAWLVTAGAVVYVLFVASWGLNYRRVPLEDKLEFDRTRVTEESATRLAVVAINQVNARYAAAHRKTFRVERLQQSLSDAHALLGGSDTISFARPKRSLLQFYFRWAAIDGMTVPVFLEIILNPDLLPFERPSTLAHEQAHIAGYADESEANFLSWLACVRSGDPVAEYSGWLDAYRHAVGSLPRATRASLPRLDEGPRRDLAEIAARYERSSPRVRSAARGVYDSYLKANRIEEGIDNYAVVLQLMLGTSFGDNWTPVLR